MPFTLSPSSLSLVKDCKRCFWLHFNKDIKRPNGIFPSLPSGMDRILKTHFDAFRDKNELPPELRHLEGYNLFRDVALLETWRNNRKGIRWTDSNENIIRGAVDNILEKGRKLVVLDYKTRGFPLKDDTHEHYIDQLNIYNLLLQKNGYKTEKYSYLLFYHPKCVNGDGTVVFNTDLKKIPTSAEKGEEFIKEAIEVLNGELPEGNCEFCKWRELKI